MSPYARPTSDKTNPIVFLTGKTCPPQSDQPYHDPEIVKRRTFLGTIGSFATPVAPARRPNVLLFMADQMRRDCLGCYGNPVIRTPHLDRIAAEGTRFDSNIGQNPVCSPSRASILTGRYPRTNGVRSNGVGLRTSEVTLAGHLRSNGYRTGAFGKLHLVPQLASAPARMSAVNGPYYGFDTFHITEDPKVGEYLEFVERTAPGYLAAVRKSNAGIPVELHQSHWIADRTIDFIREQTHSGSPFFALCSFVDPHHPCDPPEPYRSMYDPADIPAPRRKAGEMKDKPPYFAEFADAWAQQVAGRLNSSEASVRAFASQYYGEISLLDSQIGRVLAALDAAGERENTIVAFTSDHGELLGDHGLLFKGAFLYDSLINTPLLISWPGQPGKGSAVGALTESMDVGPTLLELAGVTPPAAMQGHSLVSLCQGKVSRVHEATLTETVDPGGQPFLGQRFRARLETLRTRDWKLSFHHGRPFGELYDLRNDPHEFVNLWADPGYQVRRQELTDQLLDRLIGTADPLPVRNFDY